MKKHKKKFTLKEHISLIVVTFFVLLIGILLLGNICKIKPNAKNCHCVEYESKVWDKCIIKEGNFIVNGTTVYSEYYKKYFCDVNGAAFIFDNPCMKAVKNE